MNRRMIILLGLAGLLAAAYFWPGAAPVQQATTATGPAVAIPAPVTQLPERDYSALFARPLFDPTRRVAEPAQAAKAATSLDGWKLLGTYAGIGALLSDAGGQTQYMHIGDSWNGVNLVSASAGAVELDAGSGPERLELPKPQPITAPSP